MSNKETADRLHQLDTCLFNSHQLEYLIFHTERGSDCK